MMSALNLNYMLLTFMPNNVNDGYILLKASTFASNRWSRFGLLEGTVVNFFSQKKKLFIFTY